MAVSDLMTRFRPAFLFAPRAARLTHSVGFEQYRVSWKVWAVWLLVFSIFSALAIRTAHFDLGHYYVHNGWSLLNGRLDRDLAPAEMHSFLNPLHSALVWILIDRLPGPVAIGLLSLVQGLVLPALYALTARIAYRLNVDTSRTMIGLIAAVGFLTQPMIIMIGGIWNDHWGALAFIIAMAMLIGRKEGTPSNSALASAALLLGLVLGMKLTNAIYIPAFAFGVIVATRGLLPRLKAMTICAAMGLLGAIITGGWWTYVMWEKFANPVFPNLNSLFGSPQGPDMAFRDARFLPENFWDGLIRPFLFSRDGTLINEYDFTDWRFLLGYLACFLALGLIARSAIRRTLDERARALLILATGFLLTFIFWSLMFSIQRYAMGLFLIGPTLGIAVVWYLFPNILDKPKGRIALLVAAAAMVFSTSMLFFPPNHSVKWSDKYIWAELPDDLDVTDAIIIMSAQHPTSFTAPAFKDAAWLTHADARPWSKLSLDNYRPQVRLAIAQSDNPIFAVLRTGLETSAEDLQRLADDYQLTASLIDCQPMRTSFDDAGPRYALCPLQR